MGASYRGPRQTSASTGAGTRTSAPRSYATVRMARALSASTPRAVAFASALTASESRISASAMLCERWIGLPSGATRGPGRVQPRTHRVVRARARARWRARRTPKVREVRPGAERLSPGRWGGSQRAWLQVSPTQMIPTRVGFILQVGAAASAVAFVGLTARSSAANARHNLTGCYHFNRRAPDAGDAGRLG